MPFLQLKKSVFFVQARFPEIVDALNQFSSNRKEWVIKYHAIENLAVFVLENNLVDEDFDRIEVLYKLHKE